MSLPNSLNPEFVVRDYGLGLSKADVYNVFASYGASSKRDSNNFVGMYGLGSKAPFCYTDQFSIISYFEGVKYIYQAYIDDTDIGKISLLTKEQTTELSGMEIRVPIKTYDHYAFNNEATAFFRYFEPFPVITGYSIRQNTEKPLIEFDNFKYYGTKYTYPKIVMGNITYPIDQHMMSVPSIDLIIKAPIGSVEHTASREALEYKKKTKDFIDNAIKEFKTKVSENIKKTIKPSMSLYEKHIVYFQKKELIMGHLGLADTFDLTHNGKKITSTTMFMTEFKDLSVTWYRVHNNSSNLCEYYDVDGRPIVAVIGVNTDCIDKIRESTEVQKYYGSGYNFKINQYMKFDTKEALEIFKADPRTSGMVFIPVDNPKAAIAARKKAAANPLNKIKVLELSKRGSFCDSSCFTQSSATKGVYFPIYRYSSRLSESRSLQYYLRVLDKIEDKTPLYGLRESDIEKGLGSSWVSIAKHTEEKIKKYLENNGISVSYAEYKAVKSFPSCLKTFSSCWESLPAGVMKNFLEKVRNIEKHDHTLDILYNYYDATVKILDTPIFKEYKKLEEKYPLFNTIFRSYGYIDNEDRIGIIKLVNK